MSYLYVSEHGAVIGFQGNRFQVKYKDGLLKSIPMETLEVIEVFGNVQLTTQCMAECLKKGIQVIFYSGNGAYFGRLISTSHVNVHRQKMQAETCKNEYFKTEFSKKIISAKIKNQIVILRRYARTGQKDINGPVSEMKRAIENVTHHCTTIDQIMGHEGRAARIYFDTLGKLIVSDFRFKGRSKRPPLDPFNSMISLGYSIILNEIYGKLEAKGLNPYFGLMHKDREKHPTLASDLMEEWRAPLIDATALSMLNGRELNKENFYSDVEQPGVFLDKDGFRLYIKKLENKFRSSANYLSYVDYRVSFRRALDLQVNQLVKAIETGDADAYSPIIIR